MVAIENPEYSRPFDVHIWSDHPEVNQVVDIVWESFPSEVQLELMPTANKKPKSSAKRQMKVVLLDLYVAWKLDPKLNIAIGMGKDYYKAKSRYNELHISSKTPQIVHTLAASGWLDTAKGFYNRVTPSYSKATRIRASEALQKVFEQAGFGVEDIGSQEERECIILKQKEGGESKSIEYEDTELTIAMRQEVRAYTDMLNRHFIDLRSLTTPYIEVKSDKNPQRIPVTQGKHFIRRVFLRGDTSFKCGGRYYGGFWQNIPESKRKAQAKGNSKIEDYRTDIMIDGEATNELDYSNLHIAILAAEAGVDLGDDAYGFAEQLHSDIPRDQQRAFVKAVILAAINARDDKAVRGAVGDKRKGSQFEFSVTSAMVDAVLTAFRERYPGLSDNLGSDAGIRLMNIDSNIASLIVKEFVAIDEPILVVHDSFIVRESQREFLREKMAWATEQVVGQPIKFTVEQSYRTPESIADIPLRGPGAEQGAKLYAEYQLERRSGCIQYHNRLHEWWKQRDNSA